MDVWISQSFDTQPVLSNQLVSVKEELVVSEIFVKSCDADINQGKVDDPTCDEIYAVVLRDLRFAAKQNHYQPKSRVEEKFE